jgi:hypothetical protein
MPTVFRFLDDLCLDWLPERPKHKGPRDWTPAERFVVRQAEEEMRRQLHVIRLSLIRDVFGNPFRPVVIDPAWLAWNGGAVVKMARVIYDERRFEELPILADALEEAGCADGVLLEHLRSGSVHARGCWALDAVLGKS